MNPYLIGKAWVTALGTGQEAFQAALTGEAGHISVIGSHVWQGKYECFTVPPEAKESGNRHPRMRRSSPISHFAVQAARAALVDAGLDLEAQKSLAVIFAISSGSVVYTRRFYEQITQSGAGQASPLLFPETVYNAPASHLAAQLDAGGISYTLVGDGSVGVTAMRLAADLLDAGDADRVVVVGSEEVDPVLCDAYATWRMATRHRRGKQHEMLLGEGAAAVVMAREAGTEGNKQGPSRFDVIDRGETFLRQSDLPEAADALFGRLQTICPNPCAMVASTWRDPFRKAEVGAMQSHFGSVPVHFPKRSFGETLGASALMQTVFAGYFLEREDSKASVVVSSFGFNQQISGLVLAAPDSAEQTTI